MSRRVVPVLLGMLVMSAFVVDLVPVAGAAATAQQEVADSNGCYWMLNGSTYTRVRCFSNDGTEYIYQPNGRGGWTLYLQCVGTGAFQACRFADGLYVETYPDGSTYVENADRTYFILSPNGTIAESGSYDRNGVQRVNASMSTRPKSQAMERHSQTYWAVYGIVVANIIRSNPTAFDGLITLNAGAANDYANCLHLNDSRTDFDRDGYTGFNELADHCDG